jgi:hypothetical protein
MRDREPTAQEVDFFDHLVELVPGARDAYYADDDGAPWMTALYDNVVNGFVVATWRVDFDGTELVAGRSRTRLDRDEGVRWRATGKSLGRPDSVREAGHVAAA